MADIHPIRLRGPWQYEVLLRHEGSGGDSQIQQAGALPSSGKVQMPTDWENHLGADFRGRVSYVRNFGCPTALEPHEAVFLVVEGVDCFGRLELNSEPLGEMTLAAGPASFDVKSRLKERNELRVEIELPCFESAEEELRHRGSRSGLPGGLFGEVRLEIRSGN